MGAGQVEGWGMIRWQGTCGEDFSYSTMSEDKKKVYTAFNYDSKFIYYPLDLSTKSPTTSGIYKDSGAGYVSGITEVNSLVFISFNDTETDLVVINPDNSEILYELNPNGVRLESIAPLYGSNTNFLYLAGRHIASDEFFMAKIYPNSVSYSDMFIEGSQGWSNVSGVVYAFEPANPAFVSSVSFGPRSFASDNIPTKLDIQSSLLSPYTSYEISLWNDDF